jgi:hypothetical protein
MWACHVYVSGVVRCRVILRVRRRFLLCALHVRHVAVQGVGTFVFSDGTHFIPPCVVFLDARVACLIVGVLMVGLEPLVPKRCCVSWKCVFATNAVSRALNLTIAVVVCGRASSWRVAVTHVHECVALYCLCHVPRSDCGWWWGLVFLAVGRGGRNAVVLICLVLRGVFVVGGDSVICVAVLRMHECVVCCCSDSRPCGLCWRWVGRLWRVWWLCVGIGSHVFAMVV